MAQYLHFRILEFALKHCDHSGISKHRLSTASVLFSAWSSQDLAGLQEWGVRMAVIPLFRQALKRPFFAGRCRQLKANNALQLSVAYGMWHGIPGMSPWRETLQPWQWWRPSCRHGKRRGSRWITTSPRPMFVAVWQCTWNIVELWYLGSPGVPWMAQGAQGAQGA
jgi:hypothetical protein